MELSQVSRIWASQPGCLCHTEVPGNTKHSGTEAHHVKKDKNVKMCVLTLRESSATVKYASQLPKRGCKWGMGGSMHSIASLG